MMMSDDVVMILCVIQYMSHLTTITRDHYALCIGHLFKLIREKYTKLISDEVRDALFWLVGELIKRNAANVDSLCLELLRHIVSGSTERENIWLNRRLLNLFIEHKAWFFGKNNLVPASFYVFVSQIPDHHQFGALRAKEVDFCIQIAREKVCLFLFLLRSNTHNRFFKTESPLCERSFTWISFLFNTFLLPGSFVFKFNLIRIIGRDLIRVLQNVYRIPEFTALWRDLIYNPTSFSPDLKSIWSILSHRTPRVYLKTRLTADMVNLRQKKNIKSKPYFHC